MGFSSGKGHGRFMVEEREFSVMEALLCEKHAAARPWAAAVVIALAVGTLVASPAPAAVIDYYPVATGSWAAGSLVLDDSGANYSYDPTSGSPSLGSIQIYMQSSANLPTAGNMYLPVSDWNDKAVADTPPATT